MEIFKSSYFLISEKCLLENCMVEGKEVKVYTVLFSNEDMIEQLHKNYVEDPDQNFLVVVTNPEILEFVENSKYKKKLMEIVS